MTPHILVAKQRQVRVRQEGLSVQIILDGHLVLDIGWEQALVLAQAIRVQAKKAEEIVAAPHIIMDEAILLRAGVPLSLSSNRDIKKEALKEAAWNTPLRLRIRRSRFNSRSGTLYPPLVLQEKKE